MAVRKKILDPQREGDRIDLSSKLERVREAIQHLPKGEAAMSETTTPGTDAPTSPKKVVKKKPAAKKIVKKVAAKPEAGTTLAVIAKSLKMEPRKARRILRTADGVPEAGSRWTWTKASDVAKVKSILTKATKED